MWSISCSRNGATYSPTPKSSSGSHSARRWRRQRLRQPGEPPAYAGAPLTAGPEAACYALVLRWTGGGRGGWHAGDVTAHWADPCRHDRVAQWSFPTARANGEPAALIATGRADAMEIRCGNYEHRSIIAISIAAIGCRSSAAPIRCPAPCRSACTARTPGWTRSSATRPGAGQCGRAVRSCPAGRS